METIFSATGTAFYKFTPSCHSMLSHSFPTRASQLGPLRLSKPLTLTSNSDGKSLTPSASTGGAGEENLEKSLLDAIVLQVRGMACEGCASSVKKILESQPQVSSASVNLAKEMAIIWPVAEAKVIPDWQIQLGENLAKQLTSCGFSSNFQSRKATEGDIPP